MSRRGRSSGRGIVPHSQATFEAQEEGVALKINPPLSSSAATSFMHTAITVQDFKPQSALTLEILDLLHRQGVLSEKRVNDVKFCQADKDYWVLCKHCGNIERLQLHGCGWRFCPYCQAKRRRKVYGRLEEVFQSFETLRFLTLSFLNIPRLALSRDYCRNRSEQFHQFIKELSRVPHDPEICKCERCREGLPAKGYCFGTYVNVPEFKFCRKDAPIVSRSTGVTIGHYELDQWNMHQHILFDGDYIPQKVCSDLFAKVTGGESSYAFIKAPAYGQPVQRQKAALRYVLKYLGKVEGHDSDPIVIAEFYAATKKMKFYTVGIQKEKRGLLAKHWRLTCQNCGEQSWTPKVKLNDDKFGKLEWAAYEANARTLPIRGVTFARENTTIHTSSVTSIDSNATEIPIEPSSMDIEEIEDTKCVKERIIGLLKGNEGQTYDELKIKLCEPDHELRSALENLKHSGLVFEPRPDYYAHI